MPAAAVADFDIGQVASALGTVVACHAGETLFREGDPARQMYVVLSGMVEITSHGRTIEIIGPGDALGVVSLIDGLTRTADAMAATECELAMLDARSFRQAMEEVPHFVWFVMEGLAQRLRATNAAL